MRFVTQRWTALAIALVAGLGLVALCLLATEHPVALIHIVDSTGKPVAGAKVSPQGLRPKPGNYSGWYVWNRESRGVSDDPVTTDAEGLARLRYPKYVFERIETGKLCLAVDHPEYIPARPECPVSTTPPAGGPLRDWIDYLWKRIRHRPVSGSPSSVVLRRGASVRVSARRNGKLPADAQLMAQVSVEGSERTNFWFHPTPDVVVSHRLSEGTHLFRAVLMNRDGTLWFSDLTSIKAEFGNTNHLVLDFKPGVTVRGKLDDVVPRPVQQGRIVAHVWPKGVRPQERPPQWHTWARIDEDGDFEIGPLPAGDLEIVAMCAGFVSTSGPGRSPLQFRYPQRHSLGTNELQLSVPMEPTARLEVRVLDETGEPLEGVKVVTWPNIRYGDWAATILMSDCYRTADRLLQGPPDQWRPDVPDLMGISDANGLAILPNVPVDARSLAVDHSEYALPARPTGRASVERREIRLNLRPARTNHLHLRLEPIDRSPISHY